MARWTIRFRREAGRLRQGATAVLFALGACSTDDGISNERQGRIGGGAGAAAGDSSTSAAGQAAQAASGGDSTGNGGDSSSGGGQQVGGDGGSSNSGIGGWPGVIRPCGNGVIDTPETCDDGDFQPDDCCDGDCRIEPNCECPVPGEPCSRSECGDGRRTSGEVCDDGNTASGDGCSTYCSEVEEGWRCVVPGAPCTPFCGDAITLPPEECDDGNPESGDGCSSRCVVEPGAYCTGGTCVFAACGNGILEPGEACDAGESNGVPTGDEQGCSTGCTPEPDCEVLTDTDLECAAVCGNGSIEEGEACDDGNLYVGDGCSEACVVDAGYDCASTELEGHVQSACQPQCGDGVLTISEECDGGVLNGNGTYGGCRTDCTLGAHCGDGIVDVGCEECDDGVANLEDHYWSGADACTPSCARPAYCGDGVQEYQEQCDDGNQNDHDGCTSQCVVRA